jgi:methylmalonyl-CoA mutase C-terminal domain/subunit
MSETSPRASSSGSTRRIRVLIAKPGLDGHDRGVKLILRSLWEAGMEVIYTGMRVPPEGVALAAVQEDVDALGVSNHSGAHRELFSQVLRGLEGHGVGPRDLVLFCGGAIPPEDVPQLRAIGYRGVFPPGTSLEAIIEFLEREVVQDGQR